MRVTLGAAAQQLGLAFGAPGATVTDAVVPGANGSFTGQRVAPGTSGAWMSDTPLTGTAVVTLTLSGSASGRPVVVPIGATQSTTFDPVTCTVSAAAPQQTTILRVAALPLWDAPSRTWRLRVSVPGAGTVSAIQLRPTTGGGSAKPVTPKALVQSRRVAAKSAGTVTLALRPTPAGSVALASSGTIRVNVDVAFDSSAGKSAHKRLALTLSR